MSDELRSLLLLIENDNDAMRAIELLDAERASRGDRDARIEAAAPGEQVRALHRASYKTRRPLDTHVIADIIGEMQAAGFVIARLAAADAAQDREVCSKVYCNLPQGHGGEHEWVTGPDAVQDREPCRCGGVGTCLLGPDCGYRPVPDAVTQGEDRESGAVDPSREDRPIDPYLGKVPDQEDWYQRWRHTCELLEDVNNRWVAAEAERDQYREALEAARDALETQFHPQLIKCSCAFHPADVFDRAVDRVLARSSTAPQEETP
jgi:hypothetical protein